VARQPSPVAHTSFFLAGDAADPGYGPARDDPRGRTRKLCDALWRRYAPLADRHFREDARKNFLQRFWEMYLGVTLMDRGIPLQRHGDEGPEFFASLDGRRVWFEAIAPRPGEGPDRVGDIPSGEAQEIPTEKILLRLTNALDEKRKRYRAAVTKGIIGAQDAYVLALNTRGVPYAFLGDEVPYFVRAFLPFGPLTMDIDTRTLEATEPFSEYRAAIRKAKGTEIPTRWFLDGSANFCSAVLHSAVDYANFPDELGADFAVLHNPTAAVDLGSDLLCWCEQVYFDGSGLRRELPRGSQRR
jgi:hypothetical protein